MVTGFCPVAPINGNGTANTQHHMSASSYNGVIRYRHESFVCKGLSIKVCGIVVVVTDEHNPVVGFVHPLAIPLYNVVVVPFSLKSEAAIASNDDNSVCHLILDTYFVYEQVEVAVDVSTDNKAFASGNSYVG